MPNKWILRAAMGVRDLPLTLPRPLEQIYSPSEVEAMPFRSRARGVTLPQQRAHCWLDREAHRHARMLQTRHQHLTSRRLSHRTCGKPKASGLTHARTAIRAMRAKAVIKDRRRANAREPQPKAGATHDPPADATAESGLITLNR